MPCISGQMHTGYIGHRRCLWMPYVFGNLNPRDKWNDAPLGTKSHLNSPASSHRIRILQHWVCRKCALPLSVVASSFCSFAAKCSLSAILTLKKVSMSSWEIMSEKAEVGKGADQASSTQGITSSMRWCIYVLPACPCIGGIINTLSRLLVAVIISLRSLDKWCSYGQDRSNTLAPLKQLQNLSLCPSRRMTGPLRNGLHQSTSNNMSMSSKRKDMIVSIRYVTAGYVS
jgi:hypothetical protein